MNSVTQATEILLNGEKFTVPQGSAVTDLVRMLGLAEDRVAVELDRRIVSRSEWATSYLRAGASVEIVQFVGGG